MVGAWCFGCLSGPLGFTCWIFFLWNSVLFTVESLSLFKSPFISWFICSRKWCIDKLGVFHANHISMCLDPYLNQWWGWRRETNLSPPVKYFTDLLSKVDHLCFSVLCLLCLCARVCLVKTCCHLLGKGWPLGSRLWCLTVRFSLSNWYPGSGVVLDCIDPWYFHPYLPNLRGAPHELALITNFVFSKGSEHVCLCNLLRISLLTNIKF